MTCACAFICGMVCGLCCVNYLLLLCCCFIVLGCFTSADNVVVLLANDYFVLELFGVGLPELVCLVGNLHMFGLLCCLLFRLVVWTCGGMLWLLCILGWVCCVAAGFGLRLICGAGLLVYDVWAFVCFDFVGS